MKHVILLLALLCTAAYGLPASGVEKPVYTDGNRGLVFPSSLGGLSYRSMDTYDSPALGYSLNYAGGNLLNADVYVYDKGLSAIPDGCNSEVVLSELDGVRKEIESLVKRGDYAGFKYLGRSVVPSAGPVRFACDRYEFSRPDSPGYAGVRASETLLTGFAGNFVKVRFTYPKTAAEEASTVSGRLARDLALVIKKAGQSHKAGATNAVLDAIVVFRKNPLGDAAERAMAAIVAFADASDGVMVKISPEYCPWVGEDLGKPGSVLLAAYIAGCIEPQLASGRRSDRSYDGALQAITTYNQLRERNAIAKCEPVEQWIAHQKTGDLRAYIEKQGK